MIAQTTNKLHTHSVFQGPALGRLKMCEDCRVKLTFMDDKEAYQDEQASVEEGDRG